MDDSFKNRVEKIFGSLQSWQPSSQQQQRPPLWSLTDDEVEKREWRRESAADPEETLCSSSVYDFLKEEKKYPSGRSSRKKLKDDFGYHDADDDDDDDNDDDDDEGGSSQSRSRRIDGDGDEWEIRSCLGMDSTLDNEEEEDEYDKVASGRENAGERLYMSNISDHGSFLNSHNVLQRGLSHTGKKDRRANHMAARIRLKEDDEEAHKLNCHDRSSAEIRELNAKSSDNSCELRPILKRKDSSSDSKPQKRVRFDPACKNDLEEPSKMFEDYPTDALPMDAHDSNGQSECARVVPDYIQHPSRYTRYSFDEPSEVDKESNGRAIESLSELDDAPRDLPKSVTFIPKRKSASGGEVKDKEDECTKSLHPTTRTPVGIAAGATQHSEDGAMEDDEPETSAADSTAVIQKGSRSYRVKSQPDD